MGPGPVAGSSSCFRDAYVESQARDLQALRDEGLKGNGDRLGFVIASRVRLQILVELKTGNMIPSQIARESGLTIYRVSAALRELADRDLVECLNPTAARARIYRLTLAGRAVLQNLNSMTATGVSK